LVVFLKTKIEKIDQIENEQDRSEALLSFLDGIEYAIADDVHRQEPAQSEAA